MSDLVEIETEYQDKEKPEMPSKNHSLIVGRITGLLFNDERFTVMPELSLETAQIELSQFGLKAKEELIPDICVYDANTVEFIEVDDVLKMADMPRLAIEVISPRQSLTEIVNKFKAYFALGIQSCWLVMPTIKSITVYSQLTQYQTFDLNDHEVLDEVMDIRLPLQKIFSR